MRVGRHVVEAGPRVLDPGSRRRQVPVREPPEPVRDHALVDAFLVGPARLRIGHREDEPVAAAAEMEPGLGLDRHRQVGGQVERRGLEQLAAERPDRQLDAELRAELDGVGAARDHDDVGVQLLGTRPFAELDAELDGAADELARDGDRAADAVGSTEDRAAHVVDPQTRHERCVDALDRDAELGL